mgnify:CR=1 FL=1
MDLYMEATKNSLLDATKENIKGLLIVAAFALFVLSILSLCFSSWYYPLRLAHTGEVTPLVMEKKDKTFLAGKNGVYKINSVAYFQDHDKPFSVKTKDYDTLIDGQTYNVFYGKSIKYGIVSDTPLAWYQTVYYDEVHHPLIAFIGVLFVSYLLLKRTLGLLIEESFMVYDKYERKFSDEKDSMLRKLSIIGAIVPYGIVVIFVYVVGLSSIYTVYAIEEIEPYFAGLIGAFSIILMCYAPSFLLKTRHVLSDIRTVRVIGACIKISLSSIALWRLFSFTKTADFTQMESVSSLLWQLVKYIIGM